MQVHNIKFLFVIIVPFVRPFGLKENAYACKMAILESLRGITVNKTEK
jgi:hypothetical protein